MWSWSNLAITIYSTCIGPNSVTEVIFLFSSALTYTHNHVQSHDLHIHLNMNALTQSLTTIYFFPLYARVFPLLLFPSTFLFYPPILSSPLLSYPIQTPSSSSSLSLWSPLSSPLILTQPHVFTYTHPRVLTGAGWNQITDPVTFIPFWYNDDTGEANYARPKIIEER